MSKIFLSYRQSDSKPTAMAIYDRLAARFGKHNVFMDVAAIPYGADFAAYIRGILEQCAVELVIIGPQYATTAGANGQPRLADPTDLVRIEVETGLRRGIAIPVLVGDARIEGLVDSLPASLRPLLSRNATIVQADPGVDAAFGRLMTQIGNMLPPPGGPIQAPGWETAITPWLAQCGFQFVRFANVGHVVPPVCEVQAGVFRMGSSAHADEQPSHDVTVGQFWIGTHPVTVAEYRLFVEADHAPPPDRDIFWQDQVGKRAFPVVNVTWRDAMAYCAWLSDHTGQTWRLPTEAEWEKAARWDDQKQVAREYPWGDTFEASRCNTLEGSTRGTTYVGNYGAKGSSPSKAYDMGGNVWEWTCSAYEPYPYGARDGREESSTSADRVRRGGSWHSVAENARAAKRAWSAPTHFDQTIGFRLALGDVLSS